mmetsp:Transcript_5929/g.10612  ORF Transcript_5929/g.10612 Transcript_5929/m.10612 type:complete len:234 (-) Transcript_5929:1969-2670(-)
MQLGPCCAQRLLLEGAEAVPVPDGKDQTAGDQMLSTFVPGASSLLQGTLGPLPSPYGPWICLGQCGSSGRYVREVEGQLHPEALFHAGCTSRGLQQQPAEEKWHCWSRPQRQSDRVAQGSCRSRPGREIAEVAKTHLHLGRPSERPRVALQRHSEKPGRPSASCLLLPVRLLEQQQEQDPQQSRLSPLRSSWPRTCKPPSDPSIGRSELHHEPWGRKHGPARRRQSHAVPSLL